jgi:hypothetical protein
MAGPLIGNSAAFREVTEAIAMVAPVDSAVRSKVAQTGEPPPVFPSTFALLPLAGCSFQQPASTTLLDRANCERFRE